MKWRRQTATPPAPANGELRDKKGRVLRGAARAAAEQKRRDGKGPTPPRGRKKTTSSSSTPAISHPPAPSSNGKPASLRERLARVW